MSYVAAVVVLSVMDGFPTPPKPQQHDSDSVQFAKGIESQVKIISTTRPESFDRVCEAVQSFQKMW